MNHFRPSIVGRFGLLFIILAALPSLLVAFFLSRMYSSALYSEATGRSEETSSQILTNLVNEIDLVSFQAAAILYDRELRQNLDRYARTPEGPSRLVYENLIDGSLVNFFNYTNRTGAVFLRLKNGEMYQYRNAPEMQFQQGSAATEAAIAEARNNPGKVRILDNLNGFGTSSTQPVLTAAVAPLDEELETELDCLFLQFQTPYLSSLATRQDKSQSDFILYGRSGKPLVSTIDEAPSEDGQVLFDQTNGQDFHRVELRGESWLASVRDVASAGWQMVLLRNENDLTRKITTYDMLLFPMLIGLAVLFMIYVRVFFARVAAPIRSVINHMELVGSGNFGVSIPTAGMKELVTLVESFNTMSAEIVRLNRERAEGEQERLRAELDTLRYQINPHFVANTLNAIRLMAQTAKVAPVAEMTQDLMTILANSYEGGQSLSALDDEFRNVESYSRIMKVRFGGLFETKWKLGPGTGELLTLRMILQPIVENAIVHGLAGKSGRGTIEVSAEILASDSPDTGAVPYSEEHGVLVHPAETLVIEVRDDGIGIAQDAGLAGKDGGETRTVMRGNGAPGGGTPHVDSSGAKDAGRFARVGMANVDKRIRLHFGENYGLRVESEPGSYTSVFFCLPVLRRI